MVKITIELTGYETEILEFVGLCAKIELLGIWGASRTIPVDVDGDGSARLRFNIKAQVGDEKEVDLIQKWRELNKDKFYKETDKDTVETHYIGE